MKPTDYIHWAAGRIPKGGCVVGEWATPREDELFTVIVQSHINARGFEYDCYTELTRIVRCVNAHDDLVEALELARTTLDYTTADLGDDITTANAKVKIDDALAVAKGDTTNEG